MSSNHIDSLKLKLQDIPSSRGNWHDIAVFALTYDPIEMQEYRKSVANIDNVTSQSTISELRAHLYIEQRRWNHYGRTPDDKSMKKIKEIIELIRTKLQ